MNRLSPTLARALGALIVALVLHGIGTALIPGYSSAFAIRALLVIAALLAVASVGQTLVVILGGIDLSIPFLIGFGNVAAAQLYGQGMPFGVVLAVVTGTAMAIGAANGALSRGLGIHPLILTLGTGMIVQGMVLIWTKGFPSGSAPPAISAIVSIGGHLGPLPVPAIVPGVLILALAITVMLERSVFGRQIFALGSNPGAAPFAMINPLGVWTATFALSAGFSALAGILLLGFTGSAYGDVGQPYLFQTIAAVVVGGTALVGGRGSYLGTIAGALVLTEINTLLIGLGFKPPAVQAAFGVIILVLVSLYARERHLRTTM